MQNDFEDKFTDSLKKISTAKNIFYCLVLILIYSCLAFFLYTISFEVILGLSGVQSLLHYEQTHFYATYLLTAFFIFLPTFFLISASKKYTFWERFLRIYEIQAFLYLLIMAVYIGFIYYLGQLSDSLKIMEHMLYLSLVSRLFIVFFLFLAIWFCLKTQDLPTPRNAQKEKIQQPLKNAIMYAQIAGIIPLALWILLPYSFPLPSFIIYYSTVPVFFLYFYLLGQISNTGYAFWRFPFVCVCLYISVFYGLFEAILFWQLIFLALFIAQAFLIYCLYYKSNDWFIRAFSN